jgi:hypothetical protein
VGEEFHSAADFPASTEVLVPSGAKARARDNIAAIELVHTLRDAHRPATLPEQRILAAWSGWGAIPQVFDPRDEDFSADRAQIAGLLTPEQYRRAQASILNAHYTDPAVVSVIWDALGAAGFSGGRVLEPGCGSGTFIGHAPQGTDMVGVEADDVTASITALLYPSAQVRHEGFEATRVPDGSFTAAVGNVPFGRYALTDPLHNPRRHSIHNHCILKSLSLVAPGGWWRNNLLLLCRDAASSLSIRSPRDFTMTTVGTSTVLSVGASPGNRNGMSWSWVIRIMNSSTSRLSPTDRAISSLVVSAGMPGMNTSA